MAVLDALWRGCLACRGRAVLARGDHGEVASGGELLVSEAGGSRRNFYKTWVGVGRVITFVHGHSSTERPAWRLVS